MNRVAPQSRILSPWRAACIATLILSVLVYTPAMSGLAIWDDHALIGGTGIGGGQSLPDCFTHPFLLHYFRPLVSVSFFFDHHCFGSGPFFYHQTNLIIHSLTTLICIGLFLQAFRSRLAAIAGAVAFAVQPAQVSTVAWIGGRTDSLCTLFVALFAWLLLCGADSQRKRRGLFIGLSAFAFGLALLTKEQAIGLLPIVPLAFRFRSVQANRSWRSAAQWSAPFVVTSALFVAAWLAVYPSPYPPVFHQLDDQAALAGRSITYYAALLAVPTPRAMHLLSVANLERWGIWTALSGFVIAGAVVAFLIWSFRNAPVAGWFMALTVLALLPICNLVPLPSLVVAPYRAGMAGPGVAGLFAALTLWLVRCATCTLRRPSGAAAEPDESSAAEIDPAPERRPSHPRQRWAAACMAAALLALSCWNGWLTWWGASQWQSEQKIFATIVRCDPDSIVARYNLTTSLLQQHQTETALAELEMLMTRLFGSEIWRDSSRARAAIQTNPRILQRIRENQGNAIQPQSWLAALYAQRGFAQLSLKQRTAARYSFDTALAIDRNGDEANMGRAELAYEAGSYRQARGFLRVVLAARPRRAEAHMLLAHTYLAAQDWRRARTELEAWADLQPWSGQAQVEVAQARCRLGDYTGARASLEYALAHSICNTEEVRARLNDLHGRAAQFLN